MKNKYIIVKTAIDDIEIARKITYTLLEKKLVSSVQEKEVLSHFLWHKEIEFRHEYILEMCAKKSNFERIQEEIKKIHPYQVPEILAIDIQNGSDDFFNWIEEETKKDA